MTMDLFILLLLAISLVSGLVVEGIKKLLDELKVQYKSNLLAGIVSAVLSVCVGVGYIIMTETVINAKMILILIALVFLSWLGAMVGYDKVKQTLLQIKG